MKTPDQIREQIRIERLRFATQRGHLQSIAGGWVDALEWVLESDERELAESVRNK